jgi:hypothetical protein
MYKLISFILKSIIFLFVLLHIIVYILYRHQLKDIDLSIYKTEATSYKSDYYSALWVNPRVRASYYAGDGTRANEIHMETIYPIHDIAKYFIAKRNTSDPSRKISYSVVTKLSNLHHQHIKKYAIQMWISHHLTFEETANLYFKMCYYGQGYNGLKEATKGYFNKKENELDIYEIIMLVALTNTPSSLDPKRHPKKLLEKMNYLIQDLKRYFPLYYEGLAPQTELPSTLLI